MVTYLHTNNGELWLIAFHCQVYLAHNYLYKAFTHDAEYYRINYMKNITKTNPVTGNGDGWSLPGSTPQ